MPENTVGSCYIAGSSPGTREIALLSPERKITSINAVLLTGGSAFGLNATQGVVQYLEEQNIGVSVFGETILGGKPIEHTVRLFLEEYNDHEDDILDVVEKMMRY